MTIFFISDIHLNQANLASYNLLTKFFNNLPQNTQAIYILGDLFEYWIKDDKTNPFFANIRQLFNSIPNTIAIYFIHGNRDFLLDQHFADQINVQLLPQFYKINIYGYNILLTHGDYLVADRLYYCFSKIIRHRFIVLISKVLPFWLKLSITKILRCFSKYRFKYHKQAAKIYDVSQQLVEQYLLQYNCDILIHGHTHKPNLYTFKIKNHNIKDKIFTRIVLGDWHNYTNIVSFSNNSYKLEKICN